MAMRSFDTAEVDFAIRKRAFRFAESQHYGSKIATWHIVQVWPARPAEIDLFGTFDSAEYGEVVLRMVPSPLANLTKISFDLRVVCNATNVIRYQWPFATGCLPTMEFQPQDPAETSAMRERFALVCERAMAIARQDTRHSNCIILQVKQAPANVVEANGTPGSADYAEVIFRREFSAEHRQAKYERALQKRLPRPEQFRDMIVDPFFLRVVCTATDVIACGGFMTEDSPVLH